MAASARMVAKGIITGPVNPSRIIRPVHDQDPLIGVFEGRFDGRCSWLEDGRGWRPAANSVEGRWQTTGLVPMTHRRRCSHP